MLVMNNPAGRLFESISNLVTFNGALGEYSIGLHVAVILGFMLFFATAVVAVVKFRGQGQGLIAVCLRDILLAVGCAVLVFTFPGYFFFMGRAFWRAFTWRMSDAAAGAANS